MPNVPNALHDPTYQKARELYPSFLSLPETLKHQLSWALRGLADAFRWDIVISTALGSVLFFYYVIVLVNVQFLIGMPQGSRS